MQATTQQALRQLSELSPQALANSARNSAICSFNGEASTGATGKRSATRLSELEAQGPANLVRGSTASLTAEGPAWGMPAVCSCSCTGGGAAVKRCNFLLVYIYCDLNL